MTLHFFRSGAIVMLFVGFFAPLGPANVNTKSLYSYTDEKGTRIITDNYNKIPPSYRARVTAVEQEEEGYGGDIERVGKLVGSAKGFVVHVPGMSFHQSKIITY